MYLNQSRCNGFRSGSGRQKETKEEEEEEEDDDDYDDDSLCTDVPAPSEKIGREGETSVHRLPSS